MIVWVASFPRSGNTFFRILLHRLYGVPTYDGPLFLSGDDLQLDTGQRITGVEALPPAIAEALRSGDEPRAWRLLADLDSEPALYCIASHAWEAPRFGRAVLLVRDGRDVAISLAWYLLDVIRTFRRAGLRSSLAGKATAFGQAIVASLSRPLGFRHRLWRSLLREQVTSRELNWSRFNDNWLARDAPTIVVRFEDLVADPVASVGNAMRTLGVEREPAKADVPTFEALKRIHPSFFRSGRSTWREEMPAEELALFEATHGACLARLGYEAARIAGRA
ncbi:hypothetical protein BWI17_01530 [Betaproteobacteria bacterium GR16-43]|nr:hypothetical protein BWI17_01530 [Betaproteobacteria bacterium GR16-43]